MIYIKNPACILQQLFINFPKDISNLLCGRTGFAANSSKFHAEITFLYFLLTTSIDSASMISHKEFRALGFGRIYNKGRFIPFDAIHAI